MTPSEALKALSRDREAFLEEVRALGEEGTKPPPGGGWSAVQVAQHLMLAEDAFLSALASGAPLARRPIRDRLGALAVWVVFRLGLRVSIPTSRVDPTPPLPFSQVEARWREVGERVDADLRGRLGGDLRQAVVRHPVSGPLDLMELVEFLRSHIRHHRRQLRRLDEGR
ncbi:MAG: DinB family protein [Gemmatimonadales bacterium]|nr:MAG: DinB family protein [Gemmatimonadales bacterium]